jgi:hypothetical protein
MTDIATPPTEADVHSGAPSRWTQDAEDRRRARERVEREARRGVSPRAWSESDLKWAFGHKLKAEITRLEAVAAEAAGAKAEAHQRAKERERVRELAEQIIREQDAAAKVARLEAAEREARRRLGLEPDPEPAAPAKSRSR